MKLNAQETPNSILNEVSRRLNDNTRRIRVLEEKILNIDSRVNTIEQNVINATKQINTGKQETDNELKELLDRLANFEIDIQTMKKTMKKTVTHGELKEINNYIELINPITTKFITKKELLDIIENRVTDISKWTPQNND
ncbi:hypothetical protein GQ473_03910 [archaeon]|nr:hypothetical protein [archaeon]